MKLSGLCCQKRRGTDGLSSFLDRQTRAFWSGAVSAVRSHAFLKRAMSIEQLQNKLQSSLDHFVNLGNVVKDTYTTLYPSEQGMMIYALLVAGRRLAFLIKEIQWWQDRFIPDVTGIELVETRKELYGIMEYLSLCNCDMDIGFQPSENTEPIFESEEIVYEENLALLFPPKEQDSDYTRARKLMIETSKNNFLELEDCIKTVNNRIDKMLDDGKKLKRDNELRMARFKAMEDYYLKNLWCQDKAALIEQVLGEIKYNENLKYEGKDFKTEPEILEELLADIHAENTIPGTNRKNTFINLCRSDSEEVAKIVADERDKFGYDDMMSHFKYRESDKLISDHLNSKFLLTSCDDYQGKLFVNKAALGFAKLIKNAIACYVGFDNKMNAAFLFHAMRDLGLVFSEENNATLMADFMKEVYEEEISADTITRPLRKTNGQAFCMIDERNLRSFTDREFQKYKEPYWLCYSIINKVLAIEDVECADYLKQLHPTIASKDVFENLEEEDKSRLYFLSSVLRGDTLMF